MTTNHLKMENLSPEMSMFQWAMNNAKHNTSILWFFMSRALGYTLSDCKKNEEIMRELQIPRKIFVKNMLIG
jgi:hypothetical protein